MSEWSSGKAFNVKFSCSGSSLAEVSRKNFGLK